ncbi:group 1 truncated hemoglobin [bacterium (Candidatus Blackallbacteria) CG13_big_fil_rev_8_21_14_2_50_49_14]|nr:MAG: group 1 truncated hemoglobin [bacterium (Candidatus Blackallbacteria) CG13_big_fil_rev_8_21_14_2_50_49_14]
MTTLYEKYGGEPTVRALVDQFYERILADDRLKDLFKNTDMERQRKHQTAFISEVLGGPKTYKGADMRKAHAHLSLNEGHFMAVAEHLQATLQGGGVAADDLSAIMGQVASLKGEVLNL